MYRVESEISRHFAEIKFKIEFEIIAAIVIVITYLYILEKYIEENLRRKSLFLKNIVFSEYALVSANDKF